MKFKIRPLMDGNELPILLSNPIGRFKIRPLMDGNLGQRLKSLEMVSYLKSDH